MTNVLKMKELLSGGIQPKRVYVMNIEDRLFSNTIDTVHMDIVFPTFIEDAKKRLENVNKLPVLFSYGGEPASINKIIKDIEETPSNEYLPLGLFVFDISCLGDDHGKNVGELKDIAVKYDIPVIVYHTSIEPLISSLSTKTIASSSLSSMGFQVVENSDVTLLFKRDGNNVDCTTIKNRMVKDPTKSAKFIIDVTSEYK